MHTRKVNIKNISAKRKQNKSTKKKYNETGKQSNKNKPNKNKPNKNQPNKNQPNKNKLTRKKKSYNIKGGHIIMVKFHKEDDDTIKNQKNRCMCIDYDSQNIQNELHHNSESRRCSNNAEKGSYFCKKHHNCVNFLRKFTSGSEIDYNPKNWNHPYIEGSHNCYSYFLDDKSQSVKHKCQELCLKKHKNGCPKKISECGDLKPQPGDFKLMLKKGSLKHKKRDYNCPDMESKILRDNPNVVKSAFLNKCPPNYYKGAMVVDPKNTFHFYRQDKDGLWSHKPGTLPVTNLDASNRKIYIPHFSNRNYSDDRSNEDKINYTAFCGYYCIPINEYLDTYSI